MSHSGDDRKPGPNPDLDVGKHNHPSRHQNRSISSAISKPPPASGRPRAVSMPDIWFKEQALKHVILRMQLHSLSPCRSPTPQSPTSSDHESEHSASLDPALPDSFAAFSDELLLRIFAMLPRAQCISNALVCKRWLHLHGRLVHSLKLLDFEFLESSRIFHRFPNLTEIDVVRAFIKSPRNSGILVTHKSLSLPLSSQFSNLRFIQDGDFLSSDLVNEGLGLLAEGYPNLRRLVSTGTGEIGLGTIAKDCDTLQVLELHCCDDMSLQGISGCKNLQVLKLIGSLDGFYSSVVSDIGLTILANGCRRLVKLELSGCEGSYDGIKAIGQCCLMLEELTLCNHRMDGGWLSALSYCWNLKTLRLKSCRAIDLSPGPDEHLGSCPTLEELHLECCQMRDKKAVKALFSVCQTVREIVLQDCWGLENDIFSFASICRRVRFLSLKGCSLLTVQGLEKVIFSWHELEMLKVISCNSIKDGDVTPEMACLFSAMKELKWRPDSRSHLYANLSEIGIGKKGGGIFKG